MRGRTAPAADRGETRQRDIAALPPPREGYPAVPGAWQGIGKPLSPDLVGHKDQVYRMSVKARQQGIGFSDGLLGTRRDRRRVQV
jgi:hypothetical protein